MRLLTAEGLRKSFGAVRAVDDVSFELRQGELLAMIGPNGAGKSTCFNMVGGQIRPDAGRVRLGEDDITGRRPRAVWQLGVGRTFQVAAVFASMTLRENVQLALLSAKRRLWRFGRAARHYHPARADLLLQRVGLLDLADRGAGVLAHGDGKRLELAMALASRPRLLLMDEPTAGMAPEERAAVMGLIRALAKSEGIGVLFTEHDTEVVFGTADRVLVLHRGTTLAEGTPEEIRADPRVQDVYLGAA